MDIKLGNYDTVRYQSGSQVARIISEEWIEREMYCPSCNSPSLDRLPHGTKVIDFRCPSCLEVYQVKSSRRSFGNKVMDSAYGPMINAVNENRSPNLMIMHYSIDSWTVQDLILIPRQLIIPSIIEKRNELGPNAERKGWIGCNIVISSIPSASRLFAVKNFQAKNPNDIRTEWKRFEFAKEMNSENRGWIFDVLRSIQSIGKQQFTILEAYEFEEELSILHPNNQNVRPKIRQQLQLLRDRDIIRFIGRGIYELND